MSEIRDGVIGRIAGMIGTGLQTTMSDYEIAEQILSDPNVAIVDRKAELPKSRIIYDRDLASGEIIIGWQRKNCVATGDEAKTALEAIGETQQDMLKDGWVKEVEDETEKDR